VPTDESSAWGVPASAEPTENGQAKASAPAAEESEEPKSTVAAVAASAKKTWASMFAPAPKPALPKPAAKSAPTQEEPTHAPEKAADEVAHEPTLDGESLPAIPPVADEIAEELPDAIEDATSPPDKLEEPAGPEINLTPSKDELTQDNVEHLPDASLPPPTETAASTVASSKDIGSIASVATPLSTAGQAQIGRPGIGGFATTALKATSGTQRTPSFQRRLMEQREAVVMPGNHAVNQAAVQFGSLGLNGDVDDSLDVDEDREEAETRTQPPQHSPVAQPRAALPPAPRQAPPTETQPQEIPTPKQAPGLPPAPQQQAFSQQSPSGSLAAQSMQAQGSQGRQSYDQFGRYGQGGIQSEGTGAQQKSPYDAFGQQGPQSSQYDYPNQQQHNQQTSQAGGFSSAPDAFASQYSTSDQQRLAYQNYYQSYGQQGNPNQQEAGAAQQRTGSAFGAGPNDSTFSQSQQQQQVRHRVRWRISDPVDQEPHNEGPQPTATQPLHEFTLKQKLAEEVRKRVDTEENGRLARHESDKQPQAQSRYDAQNSGHNTPNPALGGQHPTGPASQQGQQGQQGQHMQQPHNQTGNYPGYNHPYYGSPYYANYMNQYGGYGQGGGYGGSFGKSMYGHQQPYGMSPQASFDQHSASPANAGGFDASSMHGRGSGFGGLGDYARSASGASQSQHNATAGSGGFGGLPDTFGRPGYGSQNSYSQQQTGPQSGNEDSLKPYGDKGTGPSPSALGAQPGRPGSATNNGPGHSGQGGVPQQSHQQGFGGYPSHLQGGGQGSQYGGLGGLGHQGGGSHQQQNAYGGGNYGGFGAGGYGSYNRGGGGWGTNYGQQH
jgi:hypothetical protein